MNAPCLPGGQGGWSLAGRQPPPAQRDGDLLPIHSAELWGGGRCTGVSAGKQVLCEGTMSCIHTAAPPMPSVTTDTSGAVPTLLYTQKAVAQGREGTPGTPLRHQAGRSAGDRLCPALALHPRSSFPRAPLLRRSVSLVWLE